MAPRKPPGIGWESWTEAQIRSAQERGEFDDLPGAGKPLPDVTGVYDPEWWVKQLMHREHLSALPNALEIKLEVERELEKIWHLVREPDVRQAVAALNADIARVNRSTIWGPPTSVAVFDVEAIVTQWRERRAAR